MSSLDQKAVEALAAAFPARPGQVAPAVPASQPETHWSASMRRYCQLEWHEVCESPCVWGCCTCTCQCHEVK